MILSSGAALVRDAHSARTGNEPTEHPRLGLCQALSGVKPSAILRLSYETLEQRLM